MSLSGTFVPWRREPVPAAARLDAHLSEAITQLSSPAAPTPPQPSKGTIPMTTPATAVQTVKELMDEHVKTMGEVQAAQLELLRASLARQRDSITTAVGSVAASINSQTDDFMAMMGQYTNNLG